MVVVLMSFLPASAHHGRGSYDGTKVITLKATVTQFEWKNPHCALHFDSTDDKGNIQNWNLETEPPLTLTERGWTRNSLNPGDIVTVDFYAAKDGTKTGVLDRVVLADGKELGHH